MIQDKSPLTTTLPGLERSSQARHRSSERLQGFRVLMAVGTLLYAAGILNLLLQHSLGWSPLLSRIVFLSNLLSVPYLGQALMQQLAKRKLAQLSVLVLVIFSGMAVWRVMATPVPAGPPRALAEFPILFWFAITFSVVTVGGTAIGALWNFLWYARHLRRTLGAICLAWGAGLAQYQLLVQPAEFKCIDASLTILVLMLLIASPYLIERPAAEKPVPVETLQKRRHRLRAYSVFLAVGTILGSIAILPVVLPFTMGLVQDVQHIYVDEVYEGVRSAYLVTEDGAMQLFDWNMPFTKIPSDAPVLEASRVHSISIVRKQFEPAENYQLIRLNDNQYVEWKNETRKSKQMILEPGQFTPGDYMLVAPQDDFYGATTYHFFRLK